IIDNCTDNQFDEFVAMAERKDAAIKHSRYQKPSHNNYGSNRNNNNYNRNKRRPSYSTAAQTSNDNFNKKKTPFKKFDKLTEELRRKIIKGNRCLYCHKMNHTIDK